MAITTLGLLIRACSWMLSLALAAMRKVRLELGITLAVAVVNVALNALLIPQYGMEGSAAATLAGFALMLALLAYYSRKLFGFTFAPETYRLFLAGAIAFLLVFAIRQPLSDVQGSLPAIGDGEAGAYSSKVLYLAYLGFLIALSVGLFALAALLLKCLHGEDVSLMRKAMARAGVPERLAALAGHAAEYGVRKGTGRGG
jgi:peptidoglycan biosynthesis protein MviN/MurJ (putative lipid II flippase)